MRDTFKAGERVVFGRRDASKIGTVQKDAHFEPVRVLFDGEYRPRDIEDRWSLDVVPEGFGPMSTAPKVHLEKLQLFTTDGEIYTGWWDAEVENFWSKRQHPSNPPIPPFGDWCCDEVAAHAEGDKRMFCGFTPIAWRAL